MPDSQTQDKSHWMVDECSVKPKRQVHVIYAKPGTFENTLSGRNDYYFLSSSKNSTTRIHRNSPTVLSFVLQAKFIDSEDINVCVNEHATRFYVIIQGVRIKVTIANCFQQ